MKVYYYGVLLFVVLLCSCQQTTVLGGGVPGPAGGYVFYDKGEYSEGWRYLECAPEDGDNNFGGYEDWYVPSIKELKWMSENLYKKGMGDFEYDYNRADYYYRKYYLSSEKDGNGYAYYVHLKTGDVDSNPSSGKSPSFYTRTVRKF
jgi:hypothetical protein